MALTCYSTYTAPAAPVWARVVSAVDGSRRLRIDPQARRLRYHAFGGWLAFPQKVEIAVIALGDTRCAVSIRVSARGNRVALTEEPRQQELLDPIVAVLDSQFPLETRDVSHEGMSCLGALVLLIVGGAVLVATVTVLCRLGGKSAVG